LRATWCWAPPGSETNVIGIDDPDEAPNWTLTRVHEVSKAIDEVALPEEGIASIWPGYIFESQAAPYPGFENNFGWGVSGKLTPEERARYHILSQKDFESGLAAHVPRVVVLGDDVLRDERGRSAYPSLMKSNSYALVRSVGGASIYVCCAKR